MNTSLDPRMLTVLKAVARGSFCYDEGGALECHYCSPQDEEEHESLCPVVLARAVLKEMDMPLCVYRVIWEHELAGKWQEQQTEVIAFSPEEAMEYVREQRPRVRATMRNEASVLLREVVP